MSRSNSLLLVCSVLAVVGIATSQDQPTCMDGIRSLEERMGDNFQGLMGGWRKVEDPASYEYSKVIDDLVSRSIQSINHKSNDLREFKLAENAELAVYQQLVNGLNFCIEFNVEVGGCKNHAADNFCRDAKKMACVVSAYKSFPAKTADIDERGPVCTTK